MSSNVMTFGPPRRFCRILISRLIFFFFTGWKRRAKGQQSSRRRRLPYFENFNDDFLMVGRIHSFEDFAVLSSTEFTHDLIIILIARNENVRRTSSYTSNFH